ncbi:TPA_asm: maturation protein [ssRNA phage Gerhypos.2_19]|uniref:Maturation protein n=2 Tax=Fiersviridae TaxID=2842319 RepID=A0A8S5L3T1_9VIRU|nr:maturation protein [ssRNA phage Gerhypos.2_19]QDH90026.1 MAG: hypothetical protein H2Bulk35283_000003 [Leviviridae sp.]DAD52076.1 TPA_asm: maturation protein [ssRNA phage Gerhypos.2_19]
MSTPAINNNQVSRVQGTVTTVVDGSVTNTTSYPNLPVAQRIETRPASVTNRKSVSGWRTPSGWSHNVQNSSLSLQSANWRNWITKTAYRQYIDGAGWNTEVGDVVSPGSNDESRAIIKALSKLKNQKVNLAQAFFEREQLVKMTYHYANLIVNTIEAFRRKNPKYLWDYIRSFEGSRARGVTLPREWLAVQYGWRPLMKDIQGSADQIAESSDSKGPFRIGVTGVVRNNGRRNWKKATSFTGDFGINVTGSYSTITKVRLDYVLVSPIVHTLNQIGILNPAKLVWELLPYSFVADWFTDIGGWLDAMDAALGFDFLGGSKTVFQTLDETGASWFNKTGNTYPYVYEPLGPPGYHNTIRRMTRTTYSSSPLPRWPGLKNPMSTGHAANLAALFATAFR